MINLEDYKTTPFGSMLTRDSIEQKQLLEASFTVPKRIKAMLISTETGAYLRGIIKSYYVPEEKAAQAAFGILQIVLGEKTLAQLPSLLSTELKLSNDKAQKMAQELEEDLLAPIMPELTKYLAEKKSDIEAAAGGAGASSSSLGVNNVLNLKDQKKTPAPPPMPGRGRSVTGNQ